jgi:WD40 repeat protein
MEEQAEKPRVQRLEPRRGLWLRWVLANLVGGVVGEALGAALTGKLIQPPSELPASSDQIVASYFSFTSPAIAIWIAFGLAQWIILWRNSGDASWWAGFWWVLVSALGGILAAFVGMFVFIAALVLIGSLSGISGAEPADRFTFILGGLASAVAVGGVGGLLVGSAQSLVLRRYFERVYMWVPGNALAWAVGLLAVVIVSGGNWLAIITVVGISETFWSVVLGGLAITVAACITGFVLVKLPARVVPQRQANWLLAAPLLVGITLLVTLTMGALVRGVLWYADYSDSNPSGQYKQFVHSDAIRGITWSPDAKLLAAGTGDGAILIWDKSNGQTVATLPGTTAGISEFQGRLDNLNNVAWSPDGNYLATSSGDKGQAIRVWDAKNWQTIITVPIAPNGQFTATAIMDLAWSPDSRALAVSIPTSEVCCDDIYPEPGLIEVLEVPTGSLKASLTYPVATLSLVWSPDGKTLAFSTVGYLLSETADTGVLLWDPSKHAGGSDDSNPRMLGTRKEGPLVMRWSPDGQFLAAGYFSSGLSLLDPNSGVEIARFTEPDRPVNDLDWSPDSMRLAVTYHKSSAQVLNIADESIVATYDQPQYATSVAWSPDGQFIATGGLDGKARLWKIE